MGFDSFPKFGIGSSIFTKYNVVATTIDGCVYYSTSYLCSIVTIFVDDGMACSVKEDSIEHILSFMGDAFKSQ
jgi:hypothetical protein